MALVRLKPRLGQHRVAGIEADDLLRPGCDLPGNEPGPASQVQNRTNRNAEVAPRRLQEIAIPRHEAAGVLAPDTGEGVIGNRAGRELFDLAIMPSGGERVTA